MKYLFGGSIVALSLAVLVLYARQENTDDALLKVMGFLDDHLRQHNRAAA